jgi:MSHA biogenesis protein MshO
MQTRERELSRTELGATLIELVVALTISAILAGALTSFMRKPMTAFSDARARAQLVDAADSALGRMKREVRLALPNSVRISADTRTLEVLHTVEGVRYRKGPGVNPAGPTDHSAASDWLDFASADSQWNVLGRFNTLTFSYGTALSSAYRIAIYPTSSAVWSEAAAGTSPGTITPAGDLVTIMNDGDEDQIGLTSAFRFAFASPRQRMFLIDGPVTFQCDLAAGTLTRYSGYVPTAAQPTNTAAAPLVAASSALLANGVSSCAFRYDAGVGTRASLVSLSLGLTSGSEVVTLLEQTHVENAP